MKSREVQTTYYTNSKEEEVKKESKNIENTHFFYNY